MQDILVKLEYLRQHTKNGAHHLQVLIDMMLRPANDRSRNQLVKVLRNQQDKMGLSL